MKTITSEVLISRLADWGVDTVLGIPEDDINGIMEGLRRNADRVRFVLVHHEEAAAFMASAYAKSTGRIGVCLATSGPGGIHGGDLGAGITSRLARDPPRLAGGHPSPGRRRTAVVRRGEPLRRGAGRTSTRS